MSEGAGRPRRNHSHGISLTLAAAGLPSRPPPVRLYPAPCPAGLSGRTRPTRRACVPNPTQRNLPEVSCTHVEGMAINNAIMQ